MAWLKFDVTTPEKPEVLAITIAMGWEDPDLTVGKLFKIWRWFDQHTVDGNAPSVTSALLDRLIGVTGLTQAVADAGWMIIHQGGLTLPNFETHNGKTAKDRALTAARVANSKSNAKGNGPSVTGALPREEKRREEVSEAKASLSSAKLPPCPHTEIIDLFAKHLPALPQPKPEMWTGARAKNLSARWKWLLTATKRNGERYANNREEALEWLERFFSYVSGSDFLSGRSGHFTGCDLGWLVNEANFAKVVQGNYENKKEAA